jgi:hypothetical protein
MMAQIASVEKGSIFADFVNEIAAGDMYNE